MNLLRYTSKKSAIALAKAEVPKELSFSEFSDIVSRDPRVPSWYDTQSGEKANTVFSDYLGGSVWDPRYGIEETIGCGLIPSMLTRDGFIENMFDYGFQGRDSTGILIAGTRGGNTRVTGHMTVIGAGTRRTERHLPSAIESFLMHTGLQQQPWGRREKEEFDEVSSDILQTFDEKRIVKEGFYAASPLYFLGPERTTPVAMIQFQ